MSRARTPLDVVAAVSGGLAVALNVGGIIPLTQLPHAYKPGTLQRWVEETAQYPQRAELSAWLFTLGVLALVPFAVGLARRELTRRPEAEPGLTSAAAALFVVGALLNAAGTMAPLVVTRHVLPGCAAAHDCQAAARGLLAMSLALDGLFNLCLALGLGLMAAATLGSRNAPGLPRWTGVLAAVAAAPTLVVTAQPVSALAARTLALAGPLWLLYIASVSVLLARGRAPGAAPAAR